MNGSIRLEQGRALVPAEFAIVQTLNSLILILLTTFGVLQPVVARFVAESKAGGYQEHVVPGRVIALIVFNGRVSAYNGLFKIIEAQVGV